MSKALDQLVGEEKVKFIGKTESQGHIITLRKEQMRYVKEQKAKTETALKDESTGVVEEKA